MGMVCTIHQSGLQLGDRDGSGSIHIYVRKPLPKLWISPNWWAVMLSIVTAMSCRLASSSIAPRGRSMVRLVPRLIVVVHVGTGITAECNVFYSWWLCNSKNRTILQLRGYGILALTEMVKRSWLVSAKCQGAEYLLPRVHLLKYCSNIPDWCVSCGVAQPVKRSNVSPKCTRSLHDFWS